MSCDIVRFQIQWHRKELYQRCKKLNRWLLIRTHSSLAGYEIWLIIKMATLNTLNALCNTLYQTSPNDSPTEEMKWKRRKKRSRKYSKLARRKKKSTYFRFMSRKLATENYLCLSIEFLLISFFFFSLLPLGGFVLFVWCVRARICRAGARLVLSRRLSHDNEMRCRCYCRLLRLSSRYFNGLNQRPNERPNDQTNEQTKWSGSIGIKTHNNILNYEYLKQCQHTRIAIRREKKNHV